MSETMNNETTASGAGAQPPAGGVSGATSGASAASATGAKRTGRKVRTGLVVSDKMQKTVVVQIDRRVPHPVYGKMVTRSKKFKAHDEENSAKVGDTVRIMETRPLSKDKRWRVVEIVERAR